MPSLRLALIITLALSSGAFAENAPVASERDHRERFA